jgi:hypothetical protein
MFSTSARGALSRMPIARNRRVMTLPGSWNNEQVQDGNVRRVYARSFAIPGWAASVVSPCTWQRSTARFRILFAVQMPK